jgi:hypothetical protein
MRKLIVLAAVLALVGCARSSRVEDDGRLIIDGTVITSFQVDGSRCVMARPVHNGSSPALSCDHTYAIRQGEGKVQP